MTIFTQKQKIKQSLMVLFLFTAGLFMASKAQATCHASFTDTVNGKLVRFASTSTISSGGHLTYHWSFGDGTHSDNGYPTHTYASFNTSYTVCLHIYDSVNSCDDSTCQTITTNGASCTAHFSSSISLLSVSFSNSGSSALAHSHSATWSFGDGTSATGDNPSHTYSHKGDYYVKVTIVDNVTNCSSYDDRDIYVTNCALTSSFTYSMSSRTASFTSTGSSSSTMTYVWTFGDGHTDTTSGSTASHAYGGSDNDYGVNLSISDPSTGCSADHSQTIHICKALSRFHYYITGHTIQFYADSSNSSSDTYSWLLGDNGAKSTSFGPSHTYPGEGSYSVCLTATDPGVSCSSLHCESIKIVDPTYCISGNVNVANGLSGHSMVYLISYNPSDSSLKALDSFQIYHDSAKFYEFCNLKNGTYYTKAALLSANANFSSYLPTYHNDATKWSSATAIVINNSSVGNANISMKAGSNPGGPGFIGGKITAGANKVGDPEVGILVILYNASNNPIAYTHTDVNGIYGISNLAYGSYSVGVEIPGKVCTQTTVTLSSSNASVKNVNYNVGIKTITAAEGSGIKNSDLTIENANVYPNPVTDKLIINTNLQTTQRVNIQITDVAGKVISETVKTISNGPQALELDATTLHNGIYFIKMQLQNNKVLEARFVKAQ